MKQKMRKWVVVLLVISLLGSSTGLLQVSAAAGGENEDGDWIYDNSYTNTNTYYNYLQGHQDKISPDREASVDITSFKVVDAEINGTVIKSGTELYTNQEGSEKGLKIGAKGEEITFEFGVPQPGMYSIELKYLPLLTSNSQILFGLKIDGETPFIEANSCVLSRTYKNRPIEVDEDGNDLRPQADQVSKWRTQFLFDQTGVYGSLKFYLSSGVHTLSLTFDGTPLLLESLTFKQEPYQMSYQDYLSLHKQDGAKDTAGYLELFQAENYYEQSNSQLWPDIDKSSSLTQPFDYNVNKINFGGGGQWKEPGHWITWELDVPEDGFYNIGVKYRQTYLDGLFSSRRIYIDYEVPFEEMNAVRFNYTSQWKNMLLGDSNGAFSIYLTQGKHYITMENVIGDMASTMGVLQAVNAKLNDLYLAIIMITSSSPDPYRDYYLEDKIPALKPGLLECSDMLFEEAERLAQTLGIRGAENAYFEDVAYNLKSYAENIVDLTYKDRLTNLKNDLNGLSAKLAVYKEQALDLDYIALVSADQTMSKTTMNVWEWIVYQVRSFFASFKTKISTKEKGAIRVWVSTGIDQYEIMKNMIIDDFTPRTGIKVDLELSQGSLINAIASGIGPDVYLGVGSDTVVNLALRGGVVDLSQFDGYFELLDQYVEGAEIPFTLEGRYYGMPNTNGCSVMFVRTDIFNNLGLPIPQTWDDMYDVAQVLQRYNMNLGSAPSFASLLYQNGGSYFNENLTEVMFDEDVAVNALVQHAEFFTKYGFPISYDFNNRFRTGEMPIGCCGYATYTTLKYTAPEISGLWEMYVMPGTLREDGSINRTQMDNSGNGAIMLRDAENKDAAWEFIKWWSDAPAQSRYAADVEACLGISARYSTANYEVLRSQGWTSKELYILEQQFAWLKFIPIVPGNYYVGRGLTNSIRGVIDHGENARELLTEWTIKINDEILRKRTEFNLNN